MKRSSFGSAEWTWIDHCKFPREGVTVDSNRDFLITDAALQKLTLEGTVGAIVPEPRSVGRNLRDTSFTPA